MVEPDKLPSDDVIRHAAVSSDCGRRLRIIIEGRPNDMSALVADLSGAAQPADILDTETHIRLLQRLDICVGETTK